MLGGGERGVCVREREGRYDQFLYVCLQGYVCTYVMLLSIVCVSVYVRGVCYACVHTT